MLLTLSSDLACDFDTEHYSLLFEDSQCGICSIVVGVVNIFCGPCLSFIEDEKIDLRANKRGEDMLQEAEGLRLMKLRFWFSDEANQKGI